MIAVPLALALAPSPDELQAGDQGIIGDVQRGRGDLQPLQSLSFAGAR